MSYSISFDDIVKAQERIRGFAYHTPTYRAFSEESLWLKLEGFQPVRSFKIRGASNKILSLSQDQMKRGVITASSGNHGLAVAYVAHKLKISAMIVLPKNVVPEKLEMIRSLGARVEFFGSQQDERMKKATEIQKSEGLTFIQPFNDLQIIAGQGTCGLELVEDVPELETVFVPIGGGGLISGVASAIKLKSSGIRVIGVQPEGSPSMYESMKIGTPSGIRESRTIADGLSVRKPGDITFSLVRKFVDEIVLVSDDEILWATGQILKKEHVLVEPSGAASFAAVQKVRRETGKTERSAAIISGANISREMIAKIL
ncbi:MAG: threonine/serine dehydratase [Nitrososphaerota archaeon]|nr:threonine/serine dehydratase [Nitrososphaerota archaeon]MDG6923249.1 threonine/serine dehydratase [Nitrososphaerota archaeon]